MGRFFRLYLPIVLLLLLASGYSIYWYVIAERVQSGLDQWATAQRAKGYEIRWTAASVGGFPFSLKIRATGFILAMPGTPSRLRLTAPMLVASAQPWQLRRWNVEAEQTLGVTIPTGNAEAASMKATVILSDQETEIDTALQEVSGTLGGAFQVRHVDASLRLPARPPADHKEAAGTLDMRLLDWKVPQGVPTLGDTIANLSFSATLKGNVPANGGLAAWRDDGGTLEVNGFALQWGALGATGKGTLALDEEMRPLGAVTTSLEGQDAIVDALVAAGNIRQNDASLLKIALGLLAKQDADGKKRISAPVRMQNGKLYLGPATIANLPSLKDVNLP